MRGLILKKHFFSESEIDTCQVSMNPSSNSIINTIGENMFPLTSKFQEHCILQERMDLQDIPYNLACRPWTPSSSSWNESLKA